MELVVIFNILFLIYVLSIRKKTIQEVNLTTKKLTSIYNRLVDVQITNQLITDSFNDQAKNKVYELSLILMNIKSHYEQTLEMTDDYFESEYREELKKNIKAIDDQLKEIGFNNNKTKACSSILTDLYFIKDSKFSKN